MSIIWYTLQVNVYWTETLTFIHTYFVGADIGVTGELVGAACMVGTACMVGAACLVGAAYLVLALK